MIFLLTLRDGGFVRVRDCPAARANANTGSPFDYTPPFLLVLEGLRQLSDNDWDMCIGFVGKLCYYDGLVQSIALA